MIYWLALGLAATLLLGMLIGVWTTWKVVEKQLREELE